MDNSKMLWKILNILCVSILLIERAFAVNVKTDLSQVHYLYDEGLCAINVGGPKQELRTIEVNRSTVVALSLNPSLTSTVHCLATFRAAPHRQSTGNKNRLLVSLDEINIDRPWNLSVFEGFENGVYPAATRNNITYFTRSFRKQHPAIHDFISKSDSLTVHYDGLYSPEYFGVQLTLTVVEDPDERGSCAPNHFTCSQTRLCISDDLQCNGQYNCGLYDDSDEENCVRLPDHTDYQQNYGSRDSMGRIFGALISTLLMFTAVLWVSTLCLRRAREKRELRLRHARSLRDWQTRREVYRFTRIDQSVFDSFFLAAMHRGNPNVSLMEPPPCYSVQTGLNTFELPPPYSVEMCNASSGLLVQTPASGTDCPPAYETLPRQYESRGVHDATAAAVSLLQEHDRAAPAYTLTETMTSCVTQDDETPHSSGECAVLVTDVHTRFVGVNEPSTNNSQTTRSGINDKNQRRRDNCLEIE